MRGDKKGAMSGLPAGVVEERACLARWEWYRGEVAVCVMLSVGRGCWEA